MQFFSALTKGDTIMELGISKDSLNGVKKAAIDIKDSAMDTFHTAVDRTSDMVGDLKTDLKQGASRLVDNFNGANSQHDDNRDFGLLKGEVTQIKKDLTAIMSDFQKDVSDRAHSADKYVKKNPYPYIVGAFGVGLMAAGLMKMRYNGSKNS